ncbi:MAG: VCBS repeat-containing protein [Saprospiraceae bacterium]|nr:VCBS repeat-containing protein [Saprospiraceae bacterium]
MKRQTVFLIIAILLALTLPYCTETTPTAEGEALARSHCASCHAYPAPTVLDKVSWDKYVLPRMGVLLGVLPLDSAGGNFIEPAALALDNPLIIRKEAAISAAEWAAIRAFYLNNAPAEMPAAEPLLVEQSLPQFELHFPDYFLSPPGTLMAKFTEGGLLLSDVHKGQLLAFDKTLALQQTASLPGGVVSLTGIAEGEVATCIGSFSPTDKATGSVVFLPKKQGAPPVTLVDSLRRPVHTSLADLDADGRFDLVTCEFGKWVGSLSWWKNDGRGGFERRLLRNMPGAIRTAVSDLNGDGLPDIVALFGQGDEGIFVFYNKGGGKFEEVRALRFPPSYGSSYFDLFDFNGDGHPDIVYTCGDNADFPPVSKPYHGIRIFQNDGQGNFTEALFLPLPGAYAAIPADFDLDGDLDIAAISFFPNFEKTPEAGFAFFKNQGDMKFRALTFPQSHKGRWLVMDAGDLDADGDLDLVLGSMAFETVPDGGEVKKWVKDGIPFVVLENKAR